MLLALAILAQLQPLPPQLIALASDEGERLLTSAAASRDFFALVGTFTQQASQPACGLASSVAVLNALPVLAPVIEGLAPMRGFTQDNVFTAAARQSVARSGATVDQLAGFLHDTGLVEARAVHASETTLAAFRAEAQANLARADDFVLVDFLRSGLGQDFGAHWSPLAAYNAQADRFLVLDVNRVRYPPYWAKAEDLFRAMDTSDPDAGRSRGYVLVSKRAGAPGRRPVEAVGHQLVRLVIAAALGVFFFGALCGALCGGLLLRWRQRRAVLTPPAR